MIRLVSILHFFMPYTKILLYCVSMGILIGIAMDAEAYNELSIFNSFVLTALGGRMMYNEYKDKK